MNIRTLPPFFSLVRWASGAILMNNVPEYSVSIISDSRTVLSTCLPSFKRHLICTNTMCFVEVGDSSSVISRPCRTIVAPQSPYFRVVCNDIMQEPVLSQPHCRKEDATNVWNWFCTWGATSISWTLPLWIGRQGCLREVRQKSCFWRSEDRQTKRGWDWAA